MDDVREIQNRSFKCLRKLIPVFEKYNLKYYLSGGTFLGAVRHEGFIPWDDDIDISMPRKDYEKFLSIFSTEFGEELGLQNYKTDKDYHYFITRILDTEFLIEEIRTGKITNPAVDILPLDGSPNNLIVRKMYFFWIMSIRFLISFGNRKIIDTRRKRSLPEQMVVKIVSQLPFEKIINTYKLKIFIEQNMKRYDMSTSLYSGCLMGAYRTKQMVPTAWFGNGTEYTFEDMRLNGPLEFDKYLTQMYGEYMVLPSSAIKKEKQHYKVGEVNEGI